MREVWINFGLNYRRVQSLVSANCWKIAETKLWTQLLLSRLPSPNEKNDPTSLIFGLSPYFGLSDGLSKRLIQKNAVTQCQFTLDI